MLFARVGKSEKENSYEAGQEAATIAARSIEGARRVAVVFATAEYTQEALLKGVADTLPDVPITGCSAEGVIANRWSYEGEYGVAVLLLGTDSGRFHTLQAPDYARSSRAAGRALFEQLSEKEWSEGRVLLLFPDGLEGNCTELLEELDTLLPSSLTVLGGTAGDAMKMLRTYQYFGAGVLSGGVSALLLSGSFEVRHCVSHGCEPVGSRRVVTSARGGWVYEIDGLPAWRVFQEYLDGSPEELDAEGVVFLCVGVPLGPEFAGKYNPYIIRTPTRLDKSNGALFFSGGGISEGTSIQLTRRDPQKTHSSAAQSTEQLKNTLGGVPDLVFQFDCAWRGRILYGAEAHEKGVRSPQRILDFDRPWVGFHTFGEIAPVGDRNFYHNSTVALVALYSGGNNGASQEL